LKTHPKAQPKIVAKVKEHRGEIHQRAQFLDSGSSASDDEVAKAGISGQKQFLKPSSQKTSRPPVELAALCIRAFP
jgi:hypothetical protein